jgi:ribosomal protein S18 acetylase RimI-like enzyme
VTDLSPTTAVSLRVMHPRDFPRAAHLARAALPRPGAWSRTETFVRLYQMPNVIPLVAYRPGAFAAQVLGFSVHAFDPFHYRVLVLAADPSCRRRGVGRALVTEVVARARENGAVRASASVPEGCLCALWLLAACGVPAVGCEGNGNVRMEVFL